MPQVIIIILGLLVVGVIIVLMRAKRSPVQQIPHEYFDRLWILPPGSYARWEAELDMSTAGIDGNVGFHSKVHQEADEAEGPTEKETAFCKEWMSKLDELFLLTKTAIEDAWKDWVNEDMPADWRDVLSLDGISVPAEGDFLNAWGVTYFCKPAGHYFSIEILEGKAVLESVDG